MRNAKLATVSKKTNSYTMRCKPLVWTIEKESNPGTVYGTVIAFAPSKPLVREHGSLVILTREVIPEFPHFPVFLEHDKEAQVHTVRLDLALQITLEELEHLTAFTVSVFSDLFQKSFEEDSKKFPYWFAPAKIVTGKASADSDPRHMIDWDTLKFVHDNREIFWTKEMDQQSLVEKFIYDPWDGRKRYFTMALDYSLHPSDPPPDWAPRRRWMENIMNYSTSLSKNSRPKFLDKCDWNQPVFRAECISYRRNFLDKATDAEKADKMQCSICIEPLRISPVSLVGPFEAQYISKHHSLIKFIDSSIDSNIMPSTSGNNH